MPAVALAMLALMLVPASVWKSPPDDAVYRGFDSNLVVASAASGTIDVTPGAVEISSSQTGQPTLNLATTLMPRLTASLTVTILDNAGAAEPLRIGVWSPWTSSGLFVRFGPAPGNEISTELLEHGSPSTTLVQATATDMAVSGQYRLGTPYSLKFVIDRTSGYIGAYVTGTGGQPLAGAELRRNAGNLFQNVQLSVTASSETGQGTTHVVLKDFTLTMPHQRWWAVKIDDALERALVILLALLGAGLIVLGLFAIRARIRLPAFAGRASPRNVLILCAAAATYLAINVALFPVGNHPFDGHLEELYAYVASTYGVAQLYYLPNAVSLAKYFGGIPLIESAFPYGPAFGYMYGAVGAVAGLLFGGAPPPGDVRIEYLIKSVNVLFGLADGVLILLILRQIGLDRRWTYIGAALWLFNPAVWFSMSVWGQTHVISIFFVLAVVLAIERNRPLVAWLAVAAALMTRPQMLVFGFLFAIVLLRRFPIRVSVQALSWAVIGVFLLLLPLTLAIGPTLPVDVTLNNFVIQQAGGNAASLSTVSQDAYSIWPLVTYAVSGASGLQRAFTPSSADVVGTLTYQRLGLVLTVLAMLAIGAALALRRRESLENGGYLPLVALGICSFLMLLTGVVATHFLLALPFLLLCRRWMGSIAYLYVAAIWTITTLVPMYGDMGGVISATDYPALANSVVTKVAVGLYQWDRFITVSIVANICALVWLAWLTFRRPPVTPTPV